MRSAARLLLLCAVVVGAGTSARPAEAPAGPHVHAGELARIDLGGAVVVKEQGPPVREVASRVGDATVMTSRGRPLRLPDLRPGERVMVLCAADAAGVHRAARIRIGGRPAPPR